MALVFLSFSHRVFTISPSIGHIYHLNNFLGSGPAQFIYKVLAHNPLLKASIARSSEMFLTAFLWCSITECTLELARPLYVHMFAALQWMRVT
jgi:hypothetical protein